MRLFNFKKKKENKQIEQMAALPKSDTLNDFIPDGSKSMMSEYVQRVIHIGGRPVMFTTNEFDASNIDRSNANVGLAVKITGNNVSTLPMKMRRKTRVDGQTAWVDDPDHDILKLFKIPNPVHTQYDIFTHAVQSLIITGKSFFTMNPLTGIRPPTELRPHPSWMMNLRYDKSTGWPSGYVFDPYQKKIAFDLNEVLYTHLYHMSNPFEGVNPLSAIMAEVKSNYYAMQWHQAFFKNSAMPDIMFMNKALKSMDKESEKKLLASWAERHKGYKKAFNAGILPNGMDFKQLDQKIKDMTIDAIITLNREQILGFLMVPPSEAGVLKDASYANAMMQKRSFWENSLIPLIRLICMSINRQVVWPYYGDEYEFYLDTSGVAALQDDKLVAAQAESALVNAGIETPNGARLSLGREPLDDPEANMLKKTPTPNAIVTNVDNTGDGGKSSGVKSAARKDDDPPDPRVLHWHAFDTKATKQETPMVEVVETFFEKQKKRVIDNLDTVTARGAFTDTWLFKMHQEPMELKRGESNELPDHVNNFFDSNAEDEALIKAVRPPIELAFEKAGQAVITRHGRTSFNLQNPDVLTVLSKQIRRSEYINDDTFAKLKALLDTGYEKSWTINQLENAIKDLYDTWIVGDWDFKLKLQSRARTIARTEMVTAINGGEHYGAVQAGVKYHEWLATVDGNTRFEHANADGSVVPINEPFIVGGEKLLYPGDPNGSPAMVINCRCTTIDHFDKPKR